MNHRKLCAYVLGGMSLVFAFGVAAQEGGSCEQRANALREVFEDKYLQLDEKCGRTGPCLGTPPQQPPVDQPSDSPDIAPTDRIEGGDDPSEDDSPDDGTVGICGFPDSPECTASYEALASEVAAAWDSLYAECPDLPVPVPGDGIHNGDSREHMLGNTGPVSRAPTSAELYETVKTLKKRLSRTRKFLRRARANTKECRSSGRPR